jgi:Delta3,5-Delta2,4-dienoyl-CoA isomerase
VSSALPKIFTAGIDGKQATHISAIYFCFNATLVGSIDFGDMKDIGRKALSIRKLLQDFQHSIGAPERCPFPVIVAFHGPVIGLGVDLASYCDVRYASSDATFSIKVRASQKTGCLFFCG